MLMMPLIFYIFYGFPAQWTGLLYMLVGALFSVIQQTYFMKQSKTLAGN